MSSTMKQTDKTTLRKKSNKASRCSRDSWSHLCLTMAQWNSPDLIRDHLHVKGLRATIPFCESCLLVFWVTSGIQTQKLAFLLWLNTTPVPHTGFFFGGGCWQWKSKVGSYEVMPMFCLLFIHYNSWSVLRKQWSQKAQLKVSSGVWVLGRGSTDPKKATCCHLCMMISLLWIKTTLGPKENCLTTGRINAWRDGRE